MRIIDDALLRSFRGRPCEVCRSTYGTVFHHVYQRSAGRLDVDCNGVALCFWCHHEHHQGRQPDKLACLRKIARRYGVTVARLVAVLNTLRAADKGADPGPILGGLGRATEAIPGRARDGRLSVDPPAGRDAGAGDELLRHPPVGTPEHPWTRF